MIFLLFLTLAVSSASKTYLLLGKTGSGKSSFVNVICRYPAASVSSEDSIESCTSMPSMYSSSNYSNPLVPHINLIDFPGYFDSRLSLSNEEITGLVYNLFQSIIGNGVTQIDGIIVFEDLSAELASIVNILTFIMPAIKVRRNIKKHVIVLANKYDKVEDAEAIFSSSKFEGIKAVRWSNIEDTENYLPGLLEALDGLVPLFQQDFEDIAQKLYLRAQEMYSQVMRCCKVSMLEDTVRTVAVTINKPCSKVITRKTFETEDEIVEEVCKRADLIPIVEYEKTHLVPVTAIYSFYDPVIITGQGVNPDISCAISSASSSFGTAAGVLGSFAAPFLSSHSTQQVQLVQRSIPFQSYEAITTIEQIYPDYTAITDAVIAETTTEVIDTHEEECVLEAIVQQEFVQKDVFQSEKTFEHCYLLAQKEMADEAISFIKQILKKN